MKSESFLIENGILTGYTGKDRVVKIPEGVREIGDGVFASSPTLCEVVFPESLKRIGWRAFSGCAGLTRVDIPGTVKTVGWRSFQDCVRIKEIILHEGTEILEGGFASGCSSLQRIHIPSSMKELGSWAFFRCKNLVEVIINARISEIGDLTFSGCCSLKKMELPETVKVIGIEAFYECNMLTFLKIPEKKCRIGEKAFSNCRHLESFCFPRGTETIGRGVLAGCASLEKVVLPETVKLIEEDAFSCCYNLSEIRLPAGLTSIGMNAFYECEALSDEQGLIVRSGVLYGILPDRKQEILELPLECKRIAEHVFDGMECPGMILSPSVELCCFQDEKIRFAALRGFCENHSVYSEDVRPAYAEKVYENREILCTQFIQNGYRKAFAYFTENGIMPDELYEKCFEKARSAGKPEITDMLLEYRRGRNSMDAVNKLFSL